MGRWPLKENIDERGEECVSENKGPEKNMIIGSQKNKHLSNPKKGKTTSRTSNPFSEGERRHGRRGARVTKDAHSGEQLGFQRNGKKPALSLGRRKSEKGSVKGKSNKVYKKRRWVKIPSK